MLVKSQLLSSFFSIGRVITCILCKPYNGGLVEFESVKPS